MKARWLSLALIPILLTAVVLPAGCGWLFTAKDTGPLTTRGYDFTGFTAVDVGSAFTVVITRADACSVNITTRESLFKDIRVVNSSGTLRISLSWPGAIIGSRTLEAHITMPELTSLEVSGATKATVTGFQSADRLSVRVSGASTLDLDAETGDFTGDISGASRFTARVKTGRADIGLSGASTLRLEAETGDFALNSSGASDTAGRLNAASTDLYLTGASDLQISGSGGNLRLNGSGASEARLTGLVLEDADVQLNGGSRAEVDLDGTLNVTLTGGSVLRYGGHPTLGSRMAITGGSRLEPR
jgi:hypothetical protein